VYVAAVECTAYLLVELWSSKKAAVVKVLPLASERREDCAVVSSRLNMERRATRSWLRAACNSIPTQFAWSVRVGRCLMN